MKVWRSVVRAKPFSTTALTRCDCTSIGGLILTYLFFYEITGHEIVGQHGPLMIAGVVLLLAGLVMFTTGILGAVMMRTYFESQGRHIYAVREIRTQEAGGKSSKETREI